MLLYSLLRACRYLDCMWQMIFINHHQGGYDCGDKRNCWLWPELIIKSQIKDPPLIEKIAEMQPTFGRYILCFTHEQNLWWMTVIYIWITKYPNAIIQSILAWTINWLIDLQMGKMSWTGSLLWSRPQQDGCSDLSCTAPTPASMLFDNAPLAVCQHVCRYTAKVCVQVDDQQTCGKKRHCPCLENTTLG